MSAYIVTYDLHKQGQAYADLYKRLEAYGTYWHPQGSVWIIVTTDTTVQIRDNLLPCLDHNDELFVARLVRDAAWYGYTPEVDEWIERNL